MSSVTQSIYVLATKRWLRICDIRPITNDFLQKLLNIISKYGNEDKHKEDVNELYVNIAVVGDDCCDKIGLIYNYIHDYNCHHLLENGQKSKLVKQNQTEILHFTKIVQLSSRNRVNISISCLSQLQKRNLSEICTPSTKAILFTFNLCDQNSLQNIRKWYKDCNKLFEHSSFISILVGTNYEHFKNKAANYRISVIEQSRKYANKMSAVLLFISTFHKQQINIKEIFLLILSKIFCFESNIPSISNSKLPIIEFYDHKKNKNKSKKTKTKAKRSNTIQRSSVIPATHHHQSRARQRAKYAHAHTKTSIEDIQNRLSMIRSNLRHKNNKNNTNDGNKVEELYNRFEKQYATFMKSNDNDTNKKDNTRNMYPEFLHYSKSQPLSPTPSATVTAPSAMNNNDAPQLSDLLKNDALGLNTLHTEKHTEEDQEMMRKQRKHERAMSMMPSLLNRAKTYDSTKNNAKHRTQLRDYGRHQHIRAMPSMPNFLSKLQHDEQLKNIISNVFTQTAPVPMAITPAQNKMDIYKKHKKPTRKKVKKKKKKHKKSKTNVESLKVKIKELESSLEYYQNVIHENSKTIGDLKRTISDIESQKKEATQKINISNNEKEIKVLKDKNNELQSLADALAINLKRKQQSLEEALNAIHTLNDDEKETEEISQSRSFTDNVEYIPSDEDHRDENNANNHNNDGNERRSSFTKGIARKLRSLSNSFTQINKNTEK